MSALETLLAKQEITEVLYRYCKGIDFAAEEVIRSCFHPESTHDHGGFKGLSHDFCGVAAGFMKTRESSTHMITNMMIEVDGAAARSECSFFSHQRPRGEASGPQENILYVGRYYDKFERRDGVWKIIERVGTVDYQQTMPSSDGAVTKL